MPNLHVATRKGLFTVTRNRTWEVSAVSFLGDNCPMVLPDPRDGALYAALSHGHFGNKLHRSRDGGKTWAEIAVPKYPEMPAGQEPDVNPFTQKPIPWSLNLVWELVAGSGDEPGALWAGTVPGGLFRSDDSGDSWEIVRPLWDESRRRKWFGGGMDLPGIHSVCVDPRDSKHVTVGVSCGGVWTTRDAGKTWDVIGKGMVAAYMPPEQRDDPNIQDPHRLVQCPADPEAMWVQHHCGIFASRDGGQTFRSIEKAGPSTFGFAVAVHPRDPKTAWFVPGTSDERRIPCDGNVVVTRTRDGGESFDTLTQGLPRGHAYDLVFRHALAVDDTGDLLAFGSTTGSVWVSENGGDSWQHVTAHLPPVYCVRFGNSGR